MLYESKIREYQDAAREKGIEEGMQKGTAEERARNITAFTQSLRAQHLSDDKIAEILASSFNISKAEAMKLIK